VSFLEAVVLGVVQGLTEFLPVSSSAHLRIAGEFLPNAEDPGATFTAITQIGTELAVLIYFWRDIRRIVAKWCGQFAGGPEVGGRHAVRVQDPDVRMGWLIIVGSVPIVVLGFLAQDQIRSVFRNLWLVAIVLIGFGVLLGLADRYARQVRELGDLTYRDGLIYGTAQMLALFPGVSRSGATTTAGLALGYSRPAAARYAFLLAVPAVFGSGLYELYSSITEPEADPPYGYPETAVATVVAFAVGLAVIAFLMRYISTKSFAPFVAYRIVLGLVLIALLATNVIQP
jgi:undecaprenyl-diphosphatase